MFTGVSGSGKSSLVFDTIAAESQRLINETYSAFLQGFMPSMARPEVDVLDGLTTAIIIDQERMGANPRSTVGTATDANAMLRILFSRLGKPHVGRPNAYSFNVPSVTASGAITVERGAKTKTEKATFSPRWRDVPALRGHGQRERHRPDRALRRQQVAQRGCAPIPGYSMEGWYGRIFRGCGFFDADKPIRKFTKKELHDLLYKEPTKIKVDGINLTYVGPDPADPEVLSCPRTSTRLQPHIRAFRGAGDNLHHVSRLRRYTARLTRSFVEDQRDQHRRRVHDADQRPRRLGPWTQGAIGEAAAHRAARDARLVRRDRSRLPLAGPAVRARCPAASRSARR